jgi:hypothetical protein
MSTPITEVVKRSREEEVIYLMKRYYVVHMLESTNPRRVELLEKLLADKSFEWFDKVDLQKMARVLRLQDPKAEGSIHIYGSSPSEYCNIIGLRKVSASGDVDVVFAFAVCSDYKYFGELQNGAFHGLGILKMDDTFYKGHFRNHLREGLGIYQESFWKYSGEFKDDKRNGKGDLTFQNGVKYEGDFKNDRFEGSGVYYFTNEDGKELYRYKGEFHKGVFHGYGSYISPSYKLSGMFMNGVMKRVCKLHFGGDIHAMVIPSKIMGKDYRGRSQDEGVMVCPQDILQRQLDDFDAIYSHISEVGKRLSANLVSHKGGYKMW